jgi:hypothetical protein
MKVYEFLSLHKDFLKMLHSFGISFDDCKWVELYHEYKKLKDMDHKMVYIVAFLSEKYEICERKVYKIIKSMERDCMIDAVG